MDAQKVFQAFGAFEVTYYTDVQKILMPRGTTNPAANRAAFDSAIVSATNDLNGLIDKTIANLPTSSTLQSTIQAELTGATQGMLAKLQALPTPKESTPAALRSFSKAGVSTIGGIQTLVTGQVASAPAPVGTITDQSIALVAGQVHDAFKAFGAAYANEVKTILLPSGTTDPSANRAAFDAAVANDLATLNASVATAVSGLPTALANSLTAIAANDLLTGNPATGKSLQESLLGIKTPARREHGATNVFAGLSTMAIGIGEGQFAKDAIAAVNAYNASLGTPPAPTPPPSFPPPGITG